MKILTVDIGTGTQDIFLYDSRLDIENGFKLILPSPTMMVHRRLREATRQQQGVVLHGFVMGGGPSAWAAEAHVRAGLPLYATPQAALSFNDDLDKVRAMGVQILAEEEAARLPDDILHLELRDFDFAAIRRTFESFGVSLRDLAAVAVAVFDHGNAPVDVSDRQFRFDYLDACIQAKNSLAAFAYPRNQIPPIMTRLQAVAQSANDVQAPLIVMDTAPAAVLGACFDARAAARPRILVANVGNFHTLAFRLNQEDSAPGQARIEGVFEHHTGLLTPPRLEEIISRLADGSLTHTEIFEDHGHGALVYSGQPLELNDPQFNVVVTGPRRSMLRGSKLRPHFAVPFGDMMAAGCFGLLSAVSDHLPDLRAEIQQSLSQSSINNTAPWDID